MSKLILLYHSIGSTNRDYNGITVKTENFKNHIKYLSENYLVLSVRELLEYIGTENAVAVTFDDGYEDFYTNALPIINEFNVPVTLFVSTCILHENNVFWMTQLSELVFGEREEKVINIKLLGNDYRLSLMDANETFSAYSLLRNVCMQANVDERKEIIDSVESQLKKEAVGRKAMNISQIKKIKDNPLVSIGAHSVSHPSLGIVSADYVEKEIGESIQELKKLLNRNVDLFSYPYGTRADFNDLTEEILKKYGIKYAFTTEFRDVSELDNNMCIPRCFVDDKDITEFQLFITILLNGFGHEIESNYIGCMQRDFNIRKTKKQIWIWGTGENARIVFDYLNSIGQKKRIKGFVKSNIKNSDELFMGLPVIDEVWLSNQSDINIIIRNNSCVDILFNNSFLGNKYIHIWI